ncbi:hypothetical protein NVP1161O_080 [Vibrio phage 1.161.O._10N.261.48.C5]|nr:hypothetical protein NVP1161O_080 [Vibrio phage 1.161.O._10N.261.48.C5]
MSYTQPTPEELEHLISLCKEGKTYIMPPNLTREERIQFMCSCIEEAKKVSNETSTFCDWCGKPITAWYEDPEDGTVSCRPCLNKGYVNSKEGS